MSIITALQSATGDIVKLRPLRQEGWAIMHLRHHVAQGNHDYAASYLQHIIETQNPSFSDAVSKGVNNAIKHYMR